MFLGKDPYRSSSNQVLNFLEFNQSLYTAMPMWAAAPGLPGLTPQQTTTLPQLHLALTVCSPVWSTPSFPGLFCTRTRWLKADALAPTRTVPRRALTSRGCRGMSPFVWWGTPQSNASAMQAVLWTVHCYLVGYLCLFHQKEVGGEDVCRRQAEEKQ